MSAKPTGQPTIDVAGQRYIHVNDAANRLGISPTGLVATGANATPLSKLIHWVKVPQDGGGPPRLYYQESGVEEEARRKYRTATRRLKDMMSPVTDIRLESRIARLERITEELRITLDALEASYTQPAKEFGIMSSVNQNGGL